MYTKRNSKTILNFFPTAINNMAAVYTKYIEGPVAISCLTWLTVMQYDKMHFENVLS